MSAPVGIADVRDLRLGPERLWDSRPDLTPLPPVWSNRVEQAGRHVSKLVVGDTLGSATGAVLWYYAGRWIGIDRLKRFASRHGRWLTLTPDEVDHVDRWFDRYGRWAVLFGRMVPGVRTLISVPAGVSGMPLGPFLVSTLAGSAIWTVILVLAGYELGERYSQVANVIEPVSNAVLALAVIWYLWRVVMFGRSRGGH
ncbi:DedA family protein [Acetobacter tropicalis]|uniref:DedA family protein n=1 Tax=Acetobacter tropicalis TaxID=104102 RepID=UPI000B2D15FF|nr:DedA family protein [Acetobacter tropicalis]